MSVRVWIRKSNKILIRRNHPPQSLPCFDSFKAMLVELLKREKAIGIRVGLWCRDIHEGRLYIIDFTLTWEIHANEWFFMMRERKKTEKSRGKEKYTSIHFLFLFKKKTDSIRKRHKAILTRYTTYEVSLCTRVVTWFLNRNISTFCFQVRIYVSSSYNIFLLPSWRCIHKHLMTIGLKPLCTRKSSYELDQSLYNIPSTRNSNV